jgi:hypothetical protein
MHVIHTSFHLEKAGNSPEEYEDAYWPPGRAGQWRGRKCRYAVADGATEASFSGLWAKLLVEAYGRGEIKDPTDPHTLEPLQQRWTAEARGRPLPWYAEEKALQGAYASLLGLQVISPETNSPGKWEAIAVGDSCLFHIRGMEMMEAFPLKAASDFTNRPHLIASTHAGNADLQQCVTLTSGTWEPDDVFFLITDALACCLLKAVEAGEQRWEDLRDLGTEDQRLAFEEWIGTLLRAGDLRNDDVTLLRIEPHP